MKIVVASRNPVKIEATRQAFSALMPDASIELESTNTESGVSDQPMSDAETRRGATTRAANASLKVPEADFWVGMEGGIEVIDDQLMVFAWMAVRNSTGDTSAARSVTLPLPPAVRELVEGGLELGDANDRVFATANSKQGGGAYGLLTEGRYTREGIYRQTLIIALTPFVNALYSRSN